MFSDDSLITQEEYLAELVKSIADENSSVVLYSNFVDVKSMPAMIYRVDNENKSMKGKLIIYNSNIFSLQVFTIKQYALNKNIEKFIDGFSLGQGLYKK
ncbi:MAG: hypothetical protein R2771_07585 [Saprospiraceae bacterium]